MPLARNTLAAAAATLFLTFGAMSARADCAALLAQLDQAIAAKSLGDAKTIEKNIYLDDVCSGKDTQAKDRIVALEVELVAEAGTSAATRDIILADLRNPAGWLHNWATAARVADRLFGQRHFSDATEFYDRAIALAGDPSAMSDPQKQDILKKASAAKMLASDDDQGRHKAQFASTTRGADGALGGIYAPSMRGVVPTAVPLPINFIYNSTQFSPVGEKAVAELGDYLRQQHVTDVTLIGHTDERGPDDYNVKLSEARVRRVADVLKTQGVAVHVNAIGKGWHDPLDVSRLPYTPDQEEVWALNRRVELVR